MSLKGVDALLQEVAENEEIINPQIEVQKTGEKGDGYLGAINSAKIIGDNRTISLIVKISPKDEMLRSSAPVEEFYFHEIYFYKTIYPTYTKFQKERGISRPFNGVAKCYKTSSENELIVLDDLRDLGYVMYNRKIPMDEEHVSFVMHEYGRYHAVGYAIKDQDENLYNELAKNISDVILSFSKNIDPSSYTRTFETAAKSLNPIDDKNAIERFQKFLESIPAFYKSIMASEMDEYSTITHGDCWCNNMMFKYEDSADRKKPTSMCFLDFQMTRVVSPVLDLCYFLYVCTSKEIYGNFEHYLKVYYKSLSEHMQQLGSDPNKVYPLGVFMQHWKKYCPRGLIVAIMLMRAFLSDEDEQPDLSDAARSGKNIVDAFFFESKYEDVYNQRVRDLILHFIKNDFI